MADQKSSEKYIKKMEDQLRETLENNRRLEARFEAQGAKLAENSKDNIKLTSKVVEYQGTITSLSGENDRIKEENTELAAQVAQLGDILRENRHKDGAQGKSISHPLEEDISVTDISIDDPQGNDKSLMSRKAFLLYYGSGDLIVFIKSLPY